MGRIRFVVAGLLVVAVAAAVGAYREGIDGATLTGSTVGGACSLRWGKAEYAGSLPGRRKEVSGFVASAGRTNIAWMVRDSGNPATVYSFAVGQKGKVTSREFPVKGATNGDWEDIAYTKDAAGHGHLWVLDNINRHTAPKTIWEVAEPAPGGDRTAKLLARYRWRYPEGNGNHDTETLLVMGGHLVVVSKTNPSRAYVFDEPLDADLLNTPRLLGEVPGPKLVLGSTTANGRLLLTSSTRTDTVYVADLAEGWTGTAPVFEQQMPAAQREAGDFFPDDGCDIVLVDEQENIWRLRNEAQDTAAVSGRA